MPSHVDNEQHPSPARLPTALAAILAVLVGLGAAGALGYAGHAVVAIVDGQTPVETLAPATTR